MTNQHTDEMREAFEKRYKCTAPYDEYDERAFYVWTNSWGTATARYQDALREALELVNDMVREELEYAAINNLARVENKHNIKRARLFLATINKLLGEK